MRESDEARVATREEMEEGKKDRAGQRRIDRRRRDVDTRITTTPSVQRVLLSLRNSLSKAWIATELLCSSPLAREKGKLVFNEATRRPSRLYSFVSCSRILLWRVASISGRKGMRGAHTGRKG